MSTKTSYYSGLDLGCAQDYSALVTLEHTMLPDPERAGSMQTHFAARHIHRWPLQTPYTSIVADLREWFTRPPLLRSTLVIDKTGVGAPVVDMIRDANLSADVQAFSITAGQNVGDGTVPKKDLVGAVQAALQTRRLKFSEELDLTAVLEKELEMFRVKVTDMRNEQFSSWREADHDDLVLALALALWHGERSAGDGLPRPIGFDRPRFDLPPRVGIAQLSSVFGRRSPR